MSVELFQRAAPTWERLNNREFERTKIRADGLQETTRWSYAFDEVHLLGRGQEAYIFALKEQDFLRKDKAIKIPFSSSPCLIDEFEAIQGIKKSLGHRVTGIHLSANAYFPRDKSCVVQGFTVIQSPLEECIIMRKYDCTLAQAQRGLSVSERVKAMCDVAKGLSELHRLGMMHRDIQLNNIMYDARRKEWYLIDITSKTSKETEKDDAKYLSLCVQEVLQDVPSILDQITALENPQAACIYQILISHIQDNAE